MVFNRSMAVLAAISTYVAIHSVAPAHAQTVEERVASAISTIRTLERPGRDKLAAVWDSNKYVQCRLMIDRSLRCEAAGSLMQPSMTHVLTPDRIGRLAAMGWMLDSSFGNYVQTFKSEADAADVASKIIAALTQGYDADTRKLEIATTSVRHEACPPRNGPSQNLAGLISDAPEMKATAVHACAYRPRSDEPEHKLGPGSTAADLIVLYGPMVTAEIHRLRINMRRNVYTVFDAGLGYVQCRPATGPDSFYCEAQSADSWPALASVLTPERVARLHTAGYADPGSAPNYSKIYLADQIDDTALANEILTLLHDVYGYYGGSKLKIEIEEGG